MAESTRETLLRSIEDVEATLAKFQSNNVVLATPVLLRRLEELETSAAALGDPTLIAMIVGLRRHLTTGNCMCNAMSGSRLESPSECRYGSVYAARRQYVGSIDAGYTTRRRDATVQI